MYQKLPLLHTTSINNKWLNYQFVVSSNLDNLMSHNRPQPVEKLNDEFLRDEEYIFLFQKDAKRHLLWRQLATFAVS
jgi:hypothetical protein